MIKMRKLHVLLVEDNEGDVMLTTDSFNESGLDINLLSVNDGWEALQYINKTEKYLDAATPDLVLLDINLPKMNGHEVLKHIKSNPDTLHIPVVILTTSTHDRDISDCYANHANCYIAKPMDIDEFIRTVKSLAEFWFSVVRLPLNNYK
jgi:CheY-like chemotaxis protein